MDIVFVWCFSVSFSCILGVSAYHISFFWFNFWSMYIVAVCIVTNYFEPYSTVMLAKMRAVT